MPRTLLSLLFAFLLALAGLWCSLATGSISLSVWQWLVSPDALPALDLRVIEQLRLPRTLAAFNTGALLALAGVLMQVLLRNPLAEPYVLGVSGGAAVAALIAIMFGFGLWWVSASAFLGAMLSMFIVFSLALLDGQWSTVRLLLTGVVVAAGWGALISFLLAASSDEALRGMMFWLMGDLSSARSTVGVVALVAVLGLVAWLLAPALNLFARGELQAEVLGVPVRPLRVGCYLLASLATAIAVTHAGTVGFIGLIVPHMVRILVGSDHRLLIPVAMLTGASLLLFADSLSRVVLAPQQLPVGVITALLGVPMFLVLLRRSRML